MNRCEFCNEELIPIDEGKVMSYACDECGAVWEKVGDKLVMVCEPQIEGE